MLLRFVQGRPVSGVTCALFAWLVLYFVAQGKRASWHVSHVVQEWIKTYNRHAKREDGYPLA